MILNEVGRSEPSLSLCHDSGMDSEELARLLHNLIRIGTVIDVDHSVAAVRVSTGELETDWLPWLETRAGQTTVWDPPTSGEQVVLLSPGGETAAGFVLRGIHSDLHPAPSYDKNKTVRVFPDKALLEYDHATGGMLISGINTLVVQAEASVTLTAPLITLDADQTLSTGKHTVEGLLSYLAGLSGQGGTGGGTTITGPLTHSGGDLSSNGITLHLHVHSGVRSGGDESGGPV